MMKAARAAVIVALLAGGAAQAQTVACQTLGTLTTCSNGVTIFHQPAPRPAPTYPPPGLGWGALGQGILEREERADYHRRQLELQRRQLDLQRQIMGLPPEPPLR